VKLLRRFAVVDLPKLGFNWNEAIQEKTTKFFENLTSAIVTSFQTYRIILKWRHKRTKMAAR
jgi:hypothetical protein